MVATQVFFLFSLLPGEDSHFDMFFSDGLVQPPTRYESSNWGWFLFLLGNVFSENPMDAQLSKEFEV